MDGDGACKKQFRRVPAAQCLACDEDGHDGDPLTSLAMQSSEVDSQHLARIVVTSSASGKTSSRSAVGTFWANFMRWLNSYKWIVSLPTFSVFLVSLWTYSLEETTLSTLVSIAARGTSAKWWVLRMEATIQIQSSPKNIFIFFNIDMQLFWLDLQSWQMPLKC